MLSITFSISGDPWTQIANELDARAVGAVEAGLDVMREAAMDRIAAYDGSSRSSKWTDDQGVFETTDLGQTDDGAAGELTNNSWLLKQIDEGIDTWQTSHKTNYRMRFPESYDAKIAAGGSDGDGSEFGADVFLFSPPDRSVAPRDLWDKLVDKHGDAALDAIEEALMEGG